MVKVAPAGSHELDTEVRVLMAMESLTLRHFRPPRVQGWFAWQGLDVLVRRRSLSGGAPTATWQ